MINFVLNGPISVQETGRGRGHISNGRRSNIKRAVTERLALSDTLSNLALSLSLSSSLPLHPFLLYLNVTTLAGFNVAFNPHRHIITLTFTLHSIKF